MKVTVALTLTLTISVLVAGCGKRSVQPRIGFIESLGSGEPPEEPPAR